MRNLGSIAAVLLCLLLSGGVSANDPSPEALVKGGHWKRAAALAEQRLKANPNDAQAAYLLSRVKTEYGDLDGAETLAQKAVSLDARNADYQWQLAVVYGEKADRAGVFSQFGLARKFRAEAEKAAALDPKHISSRMGLVEFHTRAPGIVGGDKKKAAAFAEEIARIHPAQGWLAQARIARINKDVAREESHLIQALAADAESYDVRMALLRFYSRPDKRDDKLLERDARKAIAIERTRIQGYTVLASLFSAQQRWKELDVILAQAEQNVPDDLSPYFHSGRILLSSNRELPRAERYLRKYLTQPPEAKAPSPASAHWQLGRVLEKQGRADEARREFEQAVRLDPKLEEAKKDLNRLKR